MDVAFRDLLNKENTMPKLSKEEYEYGMDLKETSDGTTSKAIDKNDSIKEHLGTSPPDVQKMFTYMDLVRTGQTNVHKTNQESGFDDIDSS